MATAIAVDHGWRLAITVPALIAIFMSIVLLFVTIDKPSDVGYEDQLTLGGKATLNITKFSILTHCTCWHIGE